MEIRTVLEAHQPPANPHYIVPIAIRIITQLIIVTSFMAILLDINFIVVVPTHLCMLTQGVHRTMEATTSGALHLHMPVNSKRAHQQLRPKLNRHTASSHVDMSTQNLKNILDGLIVDQCKQLVATMVHLSKPTFENIDVLCQRCRSTQLPYINAILSHFGILDSGAIDPISFDSSLFVHSNTFRMPCVNLPTGSSMPIDSTGIILFNKNITLDNVLHVPSFRLNLMSATHKIFSLLYNSFFPIFVSYRTWLWGR